MAKRNPFDIVGKTTDGKLVISGVLRFEETFGLPLEIIFEYLQENNLVPSWLHIMDESRKQGVNESKFLTKLETCVVSVYGKEYWSIIAPHLTKHAPDVVESAASVSIFPASEVSASQGESTSATTQVM